MKIKFLSWLAAVSFGMLSWQVQADMITDAHGNVGYDTAAECDAAVHNGSAKFYQSFTRKPPLLRAGEKSVKTAQIRDLGEQYAKGACDIGAGHKLGRDGVSTALQGKYVPFSPEMPINAYANADNEVVRVSMGVCDNWFSDSIPRPVGAAPSMAESEEPTAVAGVVPAAAAPTKGVRPYVFGTLGAVNSSLKAKANEANASDFRDSNNQFGGQVGVGLQFNPYLGTEVFYQGSRKHKYQDDITVEDKKFALGISGVRNQAAGVRLTAGKNLTDKFRLFGKVGAAYTEHSGKHAKIYVVDKDGGDDAVGSVGGKTKFWKPTAGIGVSYNLTDHLALRADYDHFFKKSKDGFSHRENYLGLGLQYNF